jgi:hypothetical protein
MKARIDRADEQGDPVWGLAALETRREGQPAITGAPVAC